MDQQKLNFIMEKAIPLLNNLPADATGKWGKMNGQQMVEHLADFFKISTSKIKYTLVTTQENLPRLKQFLYSDKEFRENTKAPILPDKPFPVRFGNMLDSLKELDGEITIFNDQYNSNAGLIVMHPVFGDLNFEEWVLLHYKHVTHHLKQFGLK